MENVPLTPTTRNAEHLVDLLRAVSAGDTRAFARLYALTHHKLRKTAIETCGSSPDVDDVLQDAYLKIWRHSASFDPRRASPITWMCFVLRNTAIDAARRRKLPLADLDEALAVPDQSQPAENVNVVDYQIALRALGNVPEERRRLVMMAYLRGESRQSLARHFGVPVGTIKTWLRRTLEIVRKDCQPTPAGAI